MLLIHFGYRSHRLSTDASSDSGSSSSSGVSSDSNTDQEGLPDPASASAELM